MQNLRTLLAPSLLLAALLPGQRAATASTDLPDGAPAAMSKIDIEGLRTHAFRFASDEFGGRYTGTAGQVMAAEYVASRLEELGFEPLGDRLAEDGRSYFQSYPVRKTYLDETKTGLRIGGEEHANGFGVLASRAGDGEIDVEGKIVYLGYGARTELPEQLGEGEIPLVLLRTRSRAAMKTEAQFMMGLGAFGKARQIASRLVQAGAPCVLFGVLHDDSGIGEMLNYAGLLPGKPLLQFGGDSGMAGMVAQMRVDVPMVFLSRARTVAALAAAGQAVGDDGEVVAIEGASEADAAARVRVAVATDPDAKALNVCAVLRGSDEELRNEAVVFSAHMDHMGTRVDGDVFNGADDNASGSAAFLEVAEAFAAGERPRRSVIFLSVSGEELRGEPDLGRRLPGREREHRHDRPRRRAVRRERDLDHAELPSPEVLVDRPRSSSARGALRHGPDERGPVLRAERPLQLRGARSARGVLLRRRARGLPPGLGHR